MNWVMGSVPVRAMAMGGRQARTAPEYGDVYDHFAIEYEYPNSVRVLAMCRQMDNTAYRVSNTVVGAEGQALMEQFTNFYVRGKETWEPGRQWLNPYVEEHRVLIQSIRKGDPFALSERERDVLVLLAQGASNREIASRLFITEGTVKNHISNILSKLQAENRTQAADIARRYLNAACAPARSI